MFNYSTLLISLLISILPVSYFLLRIAYSLLPIASCLLPVAYCLLPILPTAYCQGGLEKIAAVFVASGADIVALSEVRKSPPYTATALGNRR